MKDEEIDKIYSQIENGDYEIALKSIEEIIDKDAKDIDAQRLLALCEVNLEQYNEAKVILEDIIKYRQDDAICWYYLGCCYDNLEEYIEAKHAYSTVIKLRPEYVDVYKSMAIIQIKTNEPEKAIDYVNEGLKYSNGEDYSFYYIAGTACMAAKKYDECITYIQKAIELCPENVQLYNNLGTAYLTTGKFDQALETYKKSIEIDEKDSMAYFNIASILQIQEKHSEACEYFAKAHALSPEDDAYIIAWAISEVKSGDLQNATEHYKYLTAAYPQKTTYKYNLACCLQAIGEYSAAISILNQLIVLKPKSLEVMKKLASIYIAIGQVQNAKDIYERIVRLGITSHLPYYELAILCVKTGDTTRAEQMLKKVCKLKPDFAPAHKDLGVIYLNKRLFDYAKNEFEEALKYAPDDFHIVIEYANYCHATSDFETADKYYQKALQLNPHSAQALAFSALNKTHLKEIDKSIEQIEHALSHIQESAFLFYIAGRIYFLAKDYEKSKTMLIKSYELEKLPDAQNLLGLCYFELGNFQQAKLIFTNMLEKTPLNVNILLNAAKSCDKLGEKDEALKYLDKIVETFPDCEEAQELIRKIS